MDGIKEMVAVVGVKGALFPNFPKHTQRRQNRPRG